MYPSKRDCKQLCDRCFSFSLGAPPRPPIYATTFAQRISYGLGRINRDE